MHYKFLYQYSSSFNNWYCLILKNLNCTMTTANGCNNSSLLCHRWLLAAEELMQSLGSSCGIYGWYINAGTVFPWLYRFSILIVIPSRLVLHLSITCGLKSWPIRGSTPREPRSLPIIGEPKMFDFFVFVFERRHAALFVHHLAQK